MLILSKFRVYCTVLILYALIYDECIAGRFPFCLSKLSCGTLLGKTYILSILKHQHQRRYVCATRQQRQNQVPGRLHCSANAATTCQYHWYFGPAFYFLVRWRGAQHFGGWKFLRFYTKNGDTQWTSNIMWVAIKPLNAIIMRQATIFEAHTNSRRVTQMTNQRRSRWINANRG